jgi:hypothetical protein
MKHATRLEGAEPLFARTTAKEPALVPQIRRPPLGGDAVSLGTRLSELLSQETPDDLLLRLADFKRSVHDALLRASSPYQILHQLEDSGLKDCARCTQELEARLATNPHYVVLGKITEAEKLVAGLIDTKT